MKYRVTQKHCEKHLGKSLSGLLNPLESWEMRLGLGLLTIGIISITILIFVRANILLNLQTGFFTSKIFILGLSIVIGGSVSFMFAPYLFQDMFRKEIDQKIITLVNDPELLWLNFISPKKSIQETEIDWEKHDKSKLSDTNLKVFAFLKKEGTSQALHRFITGFQDSGSANKHLKRLVLKGLVEETGNDYKYIPLEFVIIDEFNREVPNMDKLKGILNASWVRMLDGLMTEE